MIVNHKYKFIFLKTRKTAGTSIEIALSEFCSDEDILTPLSKSDEQLRYRLTGKKPQNFFHGLRNHSVARKVRKEIGEDIWNSYFKFCFERNPFDKAVSLYFFKKDRKKKYKSLSMYDFFVLMNKSGRVTNFPIYSIGGTVAVDFVGRFENLHNDLNYVAEKLEFPKKPTLPVTKARFRKDKRHYSEILDEQSVEYIRNVCRKEIMRFGYEF